MTKITVIEGKDGYLSIEAKGHTQTDICAVISTSMQTNVRFLQELAQQFPEHLQVNYKKENDNMEKKNTVTEEQVTNIINNSEVEVMTVFGKTTVVTCKLPNGFVIVESSSCVDPANYDESLGIQICQERIGNKIWELEGYKLQCEVAGQ